VRVLRSIFILITITYIANADMLFLLDKEANLNKINASKKYLEKILKEDRDLGNLSKKLNWTAVVEKGSHSYYLMGTPLNESDKSIAFYWKLRDYFPKAIYMHIPSSSVRRKPPVPTPPPVLSENTQDSSQSIGDIMLWVALFLMAFVGILGLFFMSRQINKLQEHHQNMLKHQEEIEKRVNELFSNLGEKIYKLGKDVAQHTAKIKEEVSEKHLENQIQKVIDLENLIIDSANDLLGFLKLKAKKIKVEAKEFNINSLLDTVTETIVEQSRDIRSDIELAYKMDNSLPKMVMGDFEHMVEIIDKLLEHSISNVKPDNTILLDLSSRKLENDSIELISNIYFSPQKEPTQNDLINYFAPYYDENSTEYHNLGLYIASELSSILGGLLSVSYDKSKDKIDIKLTLPIKALDKDDRKYHIPRKELTKKDIVIVNRHTEASEAIKELFIYFNHQVTILTPELLHKKISGLGKYDLLMIDEKLLMEESLQNSLREIRDSYNLKVVALHNVFQPIQLLNIDDIIDWRTNKPLTQERAFEITKGIFTDFIDELSDSSVPHIHREFIKDYKEKESVNISDFRRFQGARVLIVEDNEINLKVMVKILKDTGIEVVYAHNGKEAVKIIQKQHPNSFDLVLMDINMPVMDGYKATEIIRQIPNSDKLPIVALSALTIENEIDKIEKVGMDGFLEKPLKLGKLYSVFEKYLPIKRETKTQVSIKEDKKIKKPEGIDWSKAIVNAQGNEVLLNELFKAFIDAYKDVDKDIARSYKEKNIARLRQIFLDFLGLTGSLGAKELHEEAKIIYKKLSLNKLDGLDKELAKYLHKHNILVKEIEEYLETTEHTSMVA